MYEQSPVSSYSKKDVSLAQEAIEWNFCAMPLHIYQSVGLQKVICDSSNDAGVSKFIWCGAWLDKYGHNLRRGSA